MSGQSSDPAPPRFTALRDIPLEAVTGGYSRQNLIGEKLMLSWVTLKAGAHTQSHAHENEQLIWILSGWMDVRIGKDHYTCRANDMVLIPPNEEHENWVREETHFVTVLAPPRADLRQGESAPAHLKA